MPENEVIDELVKNGIQVIYRPIALIPTEHSFNEGSVDYYIRPVATEQVDIYDALSKLIHRRKLNKDPFSK